jgi:hypothetical protein
MKRFKQIEDFFSYARTFSPPSNKAVVTALDACIIWDDDNNDVNERHFDDGFCKGSSRYSHPYLFGQANIWHDHIVVFLSHEMQSWENGIDHGNSVAGHTVKFILPLG